MAIRVWRAIRSDGPPRVERRRWGSSGTPRMMRYSEPADACSRPGKPTDYAFIDSFTGKFRAECLNQHWFMSLDDAVRKCEAWRRTYNEVRPHSAIGNKPPILLVNRSAAHGPPWPARTG